MSATTQPKRDGQLDACVGTLGNLRGLSVLEPHAGGGAFVRALQVAGAIVSASDIDPNALGLMDPRANRPDFQPYQRPEK